MNNILTQMAERGAEDLRAAIEEKEAEILAAIQKIAEEREGDAPLKFSLSLKITADLDKSTVETAVSYSVKTTVKGVHAIEQDDETPSLFGEEDA
jgi:DNA replication initiation complex subunit (GINS family)